MKNMKKLGAIAPEDSIPKANVGLSPASEVRKVYPSKLRVPTCGSLLASEASSSTQQLQTTIGLLDRLWSDKHCHFICTQDSKNSAFQTHPVANAADATRLVAEYSAKGLNVFHACSGFSTAEGRKKDNVASIEAFWFDIDCGPEKASTGKGYATQKVAQDALEKFCIDSGLPSPNCVINSGNGIHAYWILDKSIRPQLWQDCADKLKSLTVELGLTADPSRTADSASLMRTPGSMNHKGAKPLPVSVTRSDETDIPLQLMCDAINHAFDKHCEQKSVNKPLKSNADQSDAVLFDQKEMDRLTSALKSLDPDCDDATWKFHRLAILANLGKEHPDWADQLKSLARDWSSGALRGKPSIAWSTPGSTNSRTGEEIFDETWARFLSGTYSGEKATVGTIYHHAHEAGWSYRASAFLPVPSQKMPVAESSRAAVSLPVAPGQKVTATALQSVQQRYCLVKMDSKFWVFDTENLHTRNADGLALKLAFFNQKDGALLVHRALRAIGEREDDAARNARKFFTSPSTTCYDAVEFNPAGSSQNKLNLWIGPTLVPLSGGWLLIQSFLLEIICDNDQVAFEYLIRFLAHALQFPEDKPGIMVIMIGGQGIGKGTLGKILRHIWSATYYHIHKIEDVTGNFNAVLERAFIVFLDEALFAGDRKASDSLKSLVTESVIQINEKYQPARQTKSYHRFFAATNADHFKNTERDDRRDFVLKVSEARKGDLEYWSALNAEMDGNGVAAMMHDLLNMDLSGFNVRAKPNTAALVEQKLHSLSLIERWWFNALMTQEIGDHKGDDWPDFVATKAIVQDAIELHGGRLHRKPTDVEAVATMKKLCPSVSNGQRQDSLERRRGLNIPDLRTARHEFELYIGGPVCWESY